MDTQHFLEIPENSELSLLCAGAWVRVMAFAFDFLMRLFVYIMISFTLGLFEPAPGVMVGVMAIATFLLEWFYPVCFELWQDGMTPGKRYYGIKVINEDGTPVHFRNSLVRNLLRVVDFLPVLYITGLVACVCSKSFQRLGDIAAGTLVVYRNPVQGPVIIKQGGVLHPTFVPTVEEQRNLIAFAERSNRLSPQRAQELAALLQDLLPPHQDPVVAIQQIANGILGRK